MKKSVYSNCFFLPLTSAVLCSMMQISDGWFLCAFCFIPLFSALQKSDNPAKSVVVFFIVYHMVLNAFLLTMYSELGIDKLAAIVLCAVCVILITIYQSAVMLFAVIPSLRIENRGLRLLGFAILYIFGQYLLELVPVLKFPWARIELSLAYCPVFLKPASLLGSGFAALLILLFNIFLYQIILNVMKSNIKKTAISSFCLSVIYFSVLSFSMISSHNQTASDYVSVTAIQGEVEGFDKLSIDSAEAVSFYSDYIDKCKEIHPDLILLPETAIPTAISENIESKLCENLSEKTSLVYGTILKKDDERYNCLKLAREDKYYLKQTLVPFGEYIPFSKHGSSLSSGDNKSIIEVADMKLACAICIESIHSSVVFPQIASGGQLILISTNDSWFKDSYARELHFRHSILRAVEYERCVIRSANCGITAIIDYNGNIIEADYSKTASAVTARVPLIATKTMYSKVGNVMMLLPAIIVAVYYLRSLFRKVLLCTVRQA